MNVFAKPLVIATLVLTASASVLAEGWLTSYNEAVSQAKKTGKPIMVDFTGSDWCGWCIRLHGEVFDKPEFKKWAAKNVVLLELDYPHQKPQPKALKEQNDKLMRKYGSVVEGFPTVLLLKRMAPCLVSTATMLVDQRIGRRWPLGSCRCINRARSSRLPQFGHIRGQAISVNRLIVEP